MFATLRDLDNQSLVATDASTKPPPYHRPPHVVCQLCRSKKLKCSGFSPDGCARCKAAKLECIPVNRQLRSRAMGRDRKVKRVEGTGQIPSPDPVRATLSHRPVVDHCPEPSISPGNDEETLDGTSDTHIDDSVNPEIRAERSPDNDLTTDLPSPFPIGESINTNANTMDDTALTTTSTDTVSYPETQDTELSLEQAFESIAADDRQYKSCQCTEEALELLDKLFAQGDALAPASIESNSSTFQHVGALRAVVRRLELLATCPDCKDAPRLLSLLVVLCERVAAAFRCILNTLPENVLEIAAPDRRRNPGFSDPARRYLSLLCTDEQDDASATLRCGTYNLNISAETPALLTLLSLTVLQQLRRVISILCDRAQDKQLSGHMKTLGQVKEQSNSMDLSMKARLTAR